MPKLSKKLETGLLPKLPVFIYLADYPELQGHQNIPQYLQRKNQNQQTEADKDFEKLCKVAGLDPVKLNQLQGEDKSEERNQIANRVSAVVTAEIRRLWKDRPLKVRFNLDGAHFDTLISDPTTTFDVEVNLDERSRGFRWFFSFYIAFSADTDGGAAKNAILLLDEPGLYLHIQSQKDLLTHWEKDFDNQIVYTTHSPFMIPIEALDSFADCEYQRRRRYNGYEQSHGRWSDASSNTGGARISLRRQSIYWPQQSGC